MNSGRSRMHYRPLMDYEDDEDDDNKRKDDDDDDDDDNNSTIEVKTSTVCSKIPIPSTIDTSSASEDNMNPPTSSTTVASSVRSSKSCRRGKRNGSSSYVRTYDVKIDHLYDLILALETAVSPRTKWCRHVLRLLVALSEQKQRTSTLQQKEACRKNRTDMVSFEDGRLVVVLLRFLGRCVVSNAEHHLACIVLNNLSVPAENKEIIAWEHHGVRTISEMLVDSPSCHLLAVILVNLTNVKGQIMSSISRTTGLVDSLLFALRVSSLTKAEYEARIGVIEECNGLIDYSPSHRLALLMAEDQRLRPLSRQAIVPGKVLFLETSKWCLSAIHNLTKMTTCNDETDVGDILIKSGGLTLIFQYVTVHESAGGGARGGRLKQKRGSSALSTILEATPVEGGYQNQPFDWSTQSSQDIALSIILILCESPNSRDHMDLTRTIEILSAIVDYPSLLDDNDWNIRLDQKIQMDLSCFKARMALSFLLGFEGLFSQRTLRKSGSSIHANKIDSCMALSTCDVKILVEVLSNTLHGRGKAGPGGYIASSFTLKSVLRCLRCMLTHIENRKILATLVGPQLNTLLIKAIAFHSMDVAKPMVDEEDTANSICALYVLSNYSFQGLPFLPCSFADQTEREGDRSTAEGKATKILVAYLYRGSATTAGRHAAEQLLMRMPHLTFGTELNCINRQAPSLRQKDLSLDQTVLSRLEKIPVPNLKRSKPSPGIFERPIVCVGPSQKQRTTKSNRDESSRISRPVVTYPNAVLAAQQVSHDHHPESEVDEIRIANALAEGARHQSKKYGYQWYWEDEEKEIGDLSEVPTSNSRRHEKSSFVEGFSIFGLECCAVDTTATTTTT